MARKFQKYSIGGILKVPLGGGWHTYGQMTGDAEIAFFDAKTRTDLPLREIVSHPVLFRVAVDSYAVTKFVWMKVGKVPLPDGLKVPEPKYIQDALHPERFEIYLAGDIRPATREECIGLECCAVWSPEQVVDRINDHYNGVACKWLKDAI
jgi:hypothetical protein